MQRLATPSRLRAGALPLVRGFSQEGSTPAVLRTPRKVLGMAPIAREASTLGFPAHFETKAVQVKAFGKDALCHEKVALLPRTDLMDGVLIEMAGAGVNPADTYIRAGTYPQLPALPYTPGLEGAGTVLAVGPEVDIKAYPHLVPGARVCFMTVGSDGGHASSTGFYANHTVVRASLVQELPEGLDLVRAAAVPVAYFTAHRALKRCGNIAKGDTVLIRGGSGSVGLAAVQLAKHLGARAVVATASSEQGQTNALGLGATAVCGHAQEDILNALKEVASDGFDVIVELMANVNLGLDLDLLNRGGRVAIVGSRPGGGEVGIDARKILVKEAEVKGVFLWQQTPEERQKAWHDIAGVLLSNLEAPLVRTLPTSAVEEAHDMASKQAAGTLRASGKRVLTPCKEG